jgi:EAL domain-containing protein (putative c-di-GMP-specific phosphodiesterase class I)
MSIDVPVVLMSGYEVDADVAAEAIDRGVLSYLNKPFQPTELAAAVQKALRRQRAMSGGIRELIAQHMAFERMLPTVFVHRQPIVRWSKRRVEGYECLLRAREPSLPHPGAILEAAERFERLHDLGRVVRERCAEPGGPATLVFVNLHPVDIDDEQLYDATSPLGRMSERVVLEITERARFDDLDRARRAVCRLRDMGFRIAIDDIGAGFAGLSSLTTFEPDVVKLDMSLVRGIHDSRVKRRLVDTLIRVCAELSIMVIAEGVETSAELGALLDLGCDVFQGYLFAKPAVGYPDPEWSVLT